MGTSSSPRAVGAWIKKLGSRDAGVADDAREALAALGRKALGPLLDTLDDDDELLRLRALSLIALLGSASSVPPVAAELHDASSKIRERAATTLGSLPSARSTRALTRLLEREPLVRVRWAAARALVRLLQTGNEDALPAILSLVSDGEESPRVRAAALDGIPWMSRGDGDRAARDLLRRYAKDPELLVSRKAKRLIERDLKTRFEPWAVESLIADLGRRRVATWRRAVSLLSRSGGEVLDPLLEALVARPGDKTFARHCALVLKSFSPRQLSRIGPFLDGADDPVVLQVLVEVAEDAGSRQLLARVAALIDRLASGPEANGPGEYDKVRQRAHAALAASGSRIASEDLRRLLVDRRHPLRPELIEAATNICTRRELDPLLQAYLRSRGMTRLAVRDAVLQLARREKIRRTDRALSGLDEPERRAAREILGHPRDNGRRGRARARARSKIDRLEDPLLP